MNFNSIKQVAGNLQLLTQKHSPEILIFSGVIGMIGATVVACKATTKLEETIETNKADIEKIKEAEFLDSDAYKRELTFSYLRAGGRLVKLYSPAILLGGASISAVMCGHNIMRKRNLAMAAAYSALDESWNKYRRRVVSELGEEADRKFRFGSNVEDIEIEEVDDKGKKKKKKVKGENITEVSDYARFFDEGSIKWTKNAEDNLFILRNLERYANETLQARGHLFLNEVYDMLDIPRTREGAVVGWKLGNGDDYVSFGIYERGQESEAVRRFVNGVENVILLDFNVDQGFIYDKI